MVESPTIYALRRHKKTAIVKQRAKGAVNVDKLARVSQIASAEQFKRYKTV